MTANGGSARGRFLVVLLALASIACWVIPSWGQVSEIAGTYRGDSVASDGSKAQARLRLNVDGGSVSGSLVLRSGGQEVQISLGSGQLSGEHLKMSARFAGNAGTLQATAEGDSIKGRVSFGTVDGSELWFDIDVVAVAEGGGKGTNQPQRATALLRGIGQDSTALAAFVDQQVSTLGELPPPPGKAAEIASLSSEAGSGQAAAYAYGVNRVALARATLLAGKGLLDSGDYKQARALVERGAVLSDEGSRLLRIATGSFGGESARAVQKIVNGYPGSSEAGRSGWPFSCGVRCLEPTEAVLTMADIATAASGRNLDAAGLAALRTALLSVLADVTEIRPAVESRTTALLAESGFYDTVDGALQSPDTVRAVIGGLSRSPALSGRSDVPSVGRDVVSRAASFIQSVKVAEPRIPAGMEERWVDLKPGETARGFRLARDGSMTCQGKVVSGKLALGGAGGQAAVPARAVLSPASPSGRYYVLQGCESAASGTPCNAFFLFDGQATEIKPLKVGRYGADAWVSWEAGEKYALLAYTEGVTSLYRLDPTGGTVEKFPLEKLCASGELPHLQVNTVQIDRDTEKGLAQVDIKCDFFQDPACDSARVKRSVSAVVDIAALGVQGPPPGKASSGGVVRGSGGRAPFAGAVDLVGTWVGKVQEKEKNTFYDLTLALRASSGDKLEGSMTVGGLDCTVTLLSYDREGEVTLFKGKDSSKFRCMFMARMRAIPQADGSIEWKVFTMSMDNPRLHGILQRR